MFIPPRAVSQAQFYHFCTVLLGVDGDHIWIKIFWIIADIRSSQWTRRDVVQQRMHTVLSGDCLLCSYLPAQKDDLRQQLCCFKDKDEDWHLCLSRLVIKSPKPKSLFSRSLKDSQYSPAVRLQMAKCMETFLKVQFDARLFYQVMKKFNIWFNIFVSVLKVVEGAHS